MGTSKLASAQPVLMFGAVVVAFAGWITYEATNAKSSNTKASGPEAERVEGDPRVDAVLGRIHLGMPRLLVERQLVFLPPAEVDPIDLSTGSPVCRSRYRVFVSRPFPHLAPELAPHTFKPGVYVLTLEFDGRHPGHPLIHAKLSRAEVP